MRQFTIELDEMICKWLGFMAELSGKPAEHLIESIVSNQLIALEHRTFELFTDSE